MFCNSCGSKLKKGDKVCAACGTPADQGESCNGFWGLVGAVPPAPASAKQPAAPGRPSAAPTKQPAAPGRNPSPVPKKAPGFPVIGLVLLVVMLILLLVQTGRVSSLSADIRALNNRIEQLEELHEEEQTEPAEVTEPTEPAQTTEPAETSEPTDPSEPAESTEPTEQGKESPNPDSTKPVVEDSEEEDTGNMTSEEERENTSEDNTSGENTQEEDTQEKN